MQEKSYHTRLIRQKAKDLGFDASGIARLAPLDDHGRILDEWLGRGMHAGMDWMTRNADKRKDPGKLVDWGKSIIVVLHNYYTGRMQDDPEAPVLSKYAYGRDYHKTVKQKLKSLQRYMEEIIPGTKSRPFVDSAPIMEHAWAVKAGLGSFGKNSLLLNKQLGSYVFIGELITDAELDYDKPDAKDLCGNCRLCIDACPTHAINNDRTVNAGKCISYLTIEHKGALPEEYQKNFFNRVFGCDICQEVCPWNRKAKQHEVPDFFPSEEVMNMSRKDWQNLDREQFDRLFSGSAVKRTKFEGLKRNIGFLSDSDE